MEREWRVGGTVTRSSAKAFKWVRLPYVPPSIYLSFYTNRIVQCCAFCGSSRRGCGIFYFKNNFAPGKAKFYGLRYRETFLRWIKMIKFEGTYI